MGEHNSRNPAYFKMLWGRYTKQSKLLKEGHPFTHGATLELFISLREQTL